MDPSENGKLRGQGSHRRYGAWLLSTVLLVVLLLPYGALGASSTTANNPSAAPNPIDLPGGNPGSTVSSSVTVYFLNASKPIKLVVVRPTVLQTKTGYEIPSSSVVISTPLPLNVSGAVTFVVTVTIPPETLPGNYTGQLVLIGANGGVSAEGLSVTVAYNLLQYVGAYRLDLFGVIFGAVLSFAYSPVGDIGMKSVKKKSDDQTARVEQEAKGPSAAGPAEDTGAKRMSRREVAKLVIEAVRKDLRVHLTVLVTGLAVGVAIFSFFLTSAPGFGVSPFRDIALSIIDGFAIHRVLDGTVPGAKGSSN